MRNITNMSAKGVLSLTLAVTLFLSGLNSPVIKDSMSNELVNKSSKSVFNEIEKLNFSKKELNRIAENALVDGESTANEINEFTDEKDFEAAVNYAMTAYYSNENFAEMAEFEASIDDRSKSIIKGYKEAAEERAKGDSNGFEAGTVVLSFDKSTSKEEIEAIVDAEYGECREIFECFNGDYMVTVDISLGQTVSMAEKEYSEYSITEIAEANKAIEVAGEASNAVNDYYARFQYHLDTINAKPAWDYIANKKHSKVIVGVLDGGIQLDHPDLDDVISPKSADFTLNTSTPTLLSELSTPYTIDHGTLVSGVIAAEANNSSGLVGVASCYNNDVVEILMAQIMEYNPSTGGGTFYQDTAVRAMSYCVENGAKVINLSGYGSGTAALMDKAINDVTAAGVIFVCCAGNTYSNQTTWPGNSKNAISVVATTSSNTLANFSTYGMDHDFAAPGKGIYSTTLNSGITYADGTSFSAPIVASIIAMMCSLNPKLTYNEVYNILASTSKDIGLTGKSKYGLVDAYAAVKAVTPYSDIEETTSVDYEKVFNAALNKNVTVSSAYSVDTFPISNLVDDNTTTKWISEATAGQWLQIDLGKSYYLQYVEVNIERYANAACEILISSDGANWTSIYSNEYKTLYSFSKYANSEKTRYVRIKFEENPTHVTISEIRVGAKEIPPTEEVTTVQETTTKANVNGPTEVFGEVVSSTAPGLINVVWGAAANGQTYNVYVDDKIETDINGKYLSNIACNMYQIPATAGKHRVKITSVLNGIESRGVYADVEVAGTIETTTVEPTTVAPTTTVNTSNEYVNVGADWTNLSHWSVYFGGWAGNPTGMYRNGNSYSDFGLKINNASNAEWGIQMKTQNIAVEVGKQYVCKVNATSNMASATNIRFKDDKSGTEISKKLVAGENTFELTFASKSEAQIFFDLGLAPAGLQLEITSFSLTKAGEVPTKEEQTTVEETTTKAQTVISNENIAKGKATYSSSNENDSYKANLATDGDKSTRWSSAWTNNEWVYVDLGANYNVAKVNVFWEGAFATQFKIQVSTDASNWTDVATLGDSYCRDYEVTFNPVNARYVRMLGITRGTTYGYSIFEMEVYAVEESMQGTPKVPVLLSGMATASSEENSDYKASYAFDGNAGTRWSSAWNDNEWLYIDLGTEKYVSYVDFLWEAAYATGYQVQVSADGVNWTTVNTVTNGKGGTERTDINRNARYVKMQGVNRSTTYGYSIFEMSVYGY